MSRKRILLIGGYGVGNYGDEAILAGLLNQLPTNLDVTVISHDPQETSKLHGVHAIRPMETIKSAGKFASVIVSGGLFGGRMGHLGKLIPLFSIASKTIGTDVEYRGLGVYPTAPKLLFPMIKASAKIARSVSVRDRLSKKTLTHIGLNNVSLVDDLSFSMHPAPTKRAIEILEKEEVDVSKSIVGISITRINSVLANEVTTMVRNIIKRNGGKSEILFLPMCRHKKSDFENDLLYSEEILQKTDGAKILRGHYHPSEILSIFGVLRSCICMRYHSMLFAHRMGINMIPIPYAEKCSEFLANIETDPPPLLRVVKLAGGVN